jgi:hypothetical protein
MLMPFVNAVEISELLRDEGSATVYFKNINNAAELYINESGLDIIRRIGASVVFR